MPNDWKERSVFGHEWRKSTRKWRRRWRRSTFCENARHDTAHSLSCSMTGAGSCGRPQPHTRPRNGLLDSSRRRAAGSSGSLNQWYAIVGSATPAVSANSEVYANSLTPPTPASSGNNGWAGGDTLTFAQGASGCVAFAGAINGTAVNSTQANALIANMHTDLNNFSGF
jgi:hypothetical protein